MFFCSQSADLDNLFCSEFTNAESFHTKVPSVITRVWKISTANLQNNKTQVRILSDLRSHNTQRDWMDSLVTSYLSDTTYIWFLSRSMIEGVVSSLCRHIVSSSINRDKYQVQKGYCLLGRGSEQQSIQNKIIVVQTNKQTLKPVWYTTLGVC